MSGSTSSARASEISWRWPADRFAPALGDRMAEPAGETGDRVERADGPGGRLDLGVGGVRPAVGDVVADRADEQVRLLRHDAEPAPVGAEVEAPDVGAVDE